MLAIKTVVRESLDPVLNYALQHINSNEHIPAFELDEYSYAELIFIRKNLKKDSINFANAIKNIRALKTRSKDSTTRWNAQVIEQPLKEQARYAHVLYCLFRGTPLCNIEQPSNNNMIDVEAIKQYAESVYIRCSQDHEKYIAQWSELQTSSNDEVDALEPISVEEIEKFVDYVKDMEMCVEPVEEVKFV